MVERGELDAITWLWMKCLSYKFSQSPSSKQHSCLWMFLCPIEPPQGGNTRHHWGNNNNRCHITTSMGGPRALIKIT